MGLFGRHFKPHATLDAFFGFQAKALVPQPTWFGCAAPFRFFVAKKLALPCLIANKMKW